MQIKFYGVNIACLPLSLSALDGEDTRFSGCRYDGLTMHQAPRLGACLASGVLNLAKPPPYLILVCEIEEMRI
jgi:hypothetical protein